MTITEITKRDEAAIQRVSFIWEKSVRATHLFLTEDDMLDISKDVDDALASVPTLLTAENENSEPVAFMGIDGDRLEMLFLLPEERGRGLGEKLLRHAIDKYSVSRLCVNEQNTSAFGFYEHMGFKVYKRTERDEQGHPFPLLYMKQK